MYKDKETELAALLLAGDVPAETLNMHPRR